MFAGLNLSINIEEAESFDRLRIISNPPSGDFGCASTCSLLRILPEAEKKHVIFFNEPPPASILGYAR